MGRKGPTCWRKTTRSTPWSTVLFVCRDERSLLGCAKVADEVLTGRIGVMGAAADHWYYPGREHMLFAREIDIHSGRLSAFALPSLPLNVRESLTGDRHLSLASVKLLSETVVSRAGAR